MDCQLSTTKDDLERMLYDHTVEPTALPLSLLTEITNGFSPEHQIGEGGFAVVYEGILKNGKVAVKRLSNKFMDDKQFLGEVECLMMTKHKNVVRFLGYCADTQGSMELYNGKLVMADVKQRLLCFEYLSKGSLVPYITDASCGLEWRNRYKIIEGISLGLHYLHQKYILHLDLKPGNILLDDNYVPKIADFGLSRVFHENQSRAITKNIRGTLGYLPHEFFNGVITYKTDCFSLGVIVIELLTGKKGYHDVDQVLESWSNRLEKSHRDIQREQVRVCAQIGMECIKSNPAERPVSMEHIIARLHETGNAEGSIETIMTRSSPLQAKTDNDDPDHGSPKALGGTSSETSYVFALDDEVPPMVVSATSSDQLRRVSAPKGLGETSTETNSVSELVDEVPSTAVSAAASDQQRGITAPKRLGETRSEDFSFSGPSISVSDPMSESRGCMEPGGATSYLEPEAALQLHGLSSQSGLRHHIRREHGGSESSNDRRPRPRMKHLGPGGLQVPLSATGSATSSCRLVDPADRSRLASGVEVVPSFSTSSSSSSSLSSSTLIISALPSSGQSLKSLGAVGLP